MSLEATSPGVSNHTTDALPGLGPDDDATPERVGAIAAALHTQIRDSMSEIEGINLQARLLSINAQIEAARAGEIGRSFAIVGQEMVGLSQRTQQAAESLGRVTEALVLELADVSRRLGTDVRGRRLADLALHNVDLIDRNLYERTCDVRWWATDAAVVAALEDPKEYAGVYASQRLGVILNAYTVYFDIVLADLDGTVVANGRPEKYDVAGRVVRETRWFASAMATASGDEYGFESVHACPLVGGRRALVYSCKVNRGGDANGEPVGVLGVVFDWDGLAQTIVRGTPIEDEKRATTRVCIVDDAGLVLADTDDRQLEDTLDLPDRAELFAQEKTSRIFTRDRERTLVAHARSPGFETYRTGWHGIVLERLPRAR